MFKKLLSALLVLSAMLVSIPALSASVNLGSSLTLNPSSSLDCAILWQASGGDSIFGQSSPVASSSVNRILVNPVDSSYADKIKLDATVALNTNLKDVRISADLDTDLKIKNIYDQNSATQNFDVNLNSILDLSGAYFKFNRFNVSNLNTTGATGDWYVQNFNLNNDQIKASKDVAAIFSEVLATPKSQVYSNASEARMQQMLCKMIDKVDVSGSQNLSVGSGTYAQSRQVRVVSVTLKSNYEEILAQELPEVIQVLVNDSTFTGFLKNQYSRVVRFAKNMDILSGSKNSTSVPSQEVYNLMVDNLKNIYKKDDFAKSLNQSIAQNRELYSQTVEENKYLIDANSGQIYGMISQTKITFTDKYLTTMGADKTTGALLKSGIRVRFESYDYKVAGQVSDITLPSNAKPASSFNNLMNANNPFTPPTPVVDKATTKSSKLFDRLVSCDGKTGKLLNSKGQVIKKTPKGSNLIYADKTGLALAAEKDTISCVKSAAKYGSLTCVNNLDRKLNYKGVNAGRPTEKGYTLYMSDDFGKLFTSKFNTVVCTQDSALLGL